MYHLNLARAGGFHLLRCQEFEVNHYDFTLGRLAYESLRPALRVKFEE